MPFEFTILYSTQSIRSAITDKDPLITDIYLLLQEGQIVVRYRYYSRRPRSRYFKTMCHIRRLYSTMELFLI